MQNELGSIQSRQNNHRNTYLELGGDNAEGSHGVTAYSEGRYVPGAGVDRFWIAALDKQSEAISRGEMFEPTTGWPIEIQGSNIVVLHGSGRQ